MECIATTRMSTKGQIVIPEEIRNRLGLEPGDQFVVMGDDDVLILKTIKAPSMKDFDRLSKQAREQARKSGLRRSDIAKAVAEVRAEK